MVYKRKRSTPRRHVRRRTGARSMRPMTRTMVRTRPSNIIHSFKRMAAQLPTITGNAAYTPYVNTYVFSLSQLAAVGDFSNLYDQYRINYIVCKFWLKIDPGAQAAASASYPRFFWYRDLDDSAAPSNLNEMRENAKCKCVVMHPNRPVTVAFKPNILAQMFNNGVTTQYAPKFNQWIDMGNTGTYHYGFKFAIDDLTNTNYSVTVEATYYFQCKQPR